MKNFKINQNLMNLSKEIEQSLKDKFEKIEYISEHNNNKVLQAFLECKVSSSHFAQDTGYGYGDTGRDKLDELYATIFQTEDALVRSNFVSGTHTIATALFSILHPKDLVLSVTGTPYPTIHKTIGISSSHDNNSLIDLGVKYKEIDIFKDSKVDLNLLEDELKQNVKLVYIQRSKGYECRPSVSVKDIESIAKTVDMINPNTIIFVDNCYGEFVEKQEPTQVGADLVCGSLIKNPGGAMARTGGYIVGKKKLVNLCAQRMTAPGLGKKIGCSLNQNWNIFFGIFLAPSFVCNALKVSIFSRALFQRLGFCVFPATNEKICDIVSVIQLDSAKSLQSFCEGIQKNSPINSIYTPTPSSMPGYDDEIIMASGNFISGSSLELSCDAQITPPYNLFLQGGISYHSSKTTILKTVDKMINENLIKL